ncbi:unnamed protein product, partial [Prorocentrum cordatum]
MVQVLSHVDVNRVWSNSVCEEVAREVMQEFGGENGSIDFQEWLRLMRHCAWRHQDGCARRLSRRMDTASSIILTPTVSGFLETPQSEFMAASFTRDDEPSDVSPSAEEPSDSGCPSPTRALRKLALPPCSRIRQQCRPPLSWPPPHRWPPGRCSLFSARPRAHARRSPLAEATAADPPR